MTTSDAEAKPDAVSVPSRRLSPGAQRAVIAVLGAVLAFGGGAGVAYAFRVSPDLTAADPADMTVQDELPSIAAARAYALSNPPNYTVPIKTPTDQVVASTGAAVSDDSAYSAGAGDEQTDQAAPPSQPQPYRTAFNDDGADRQAAAPNRADAAGPTD